MRPRLLVVACVITGALAPAGAARPGPRVEAAMPGPARAGHVARPNAVAANAGCERCHADIAAEWRSSMHRRAYAEPVFQRALAREPLPFCRGCHAPEADPAHDPPRDLGELGVACVSCHAKEGGDVLARGRAAGHAAVPHGVKRSEDFATDAACASCHEFAFPGSEERSLRTLMQGTVSEHAASPVASASCASCHMPMVSTPSGRAHRSHAFSAQRDPAVLRAVVTASATRAPGDAVEVRLAAKGVGHAFPTGDLFRRLEVVAEAVGPDQNSVASDERHLSRRFGHVNAASGRFVKVTVADTRLQPGVEAVVRLALGPAARAFPIAWRVSYQRVEHPIDSDGDRAVVEADIELARGVLPP